MKSIVALLSERVYTALSTMLDAEQIPATLVEPSKNPKFADYQCNVAMGLAKALRKAPRQIAEDIVAKLEVEDISEPAEIAGPGFINFKIKTNFIASALKEMGGDERLGLEKATDKQRVLIDFSSPNLAKEMHVGHLRSTIIGDSIARFFEFEGHEVLRMNHVGDWGTQFGMLVQYIREEMPEALENPESFEIASLEDFYRAAKKRFDDSEEFADRARKAVVDLQSGDEATLAIWKVFCTASLDHCHELYEMLDIKLEDKGESAYNDLLQLTVDELKDKGLAVETEGALGVFLDGYVTADDKPMPTIVQKSDGGFIYATTDLAAIRYRFTEQKVDRAVYVTDARQRSHFDQVFEIGEKMGWAPENALKHIGFGMMLGEDGKPFKTRDGGTVKLKDLLVEAEERARKLAEELSQDLSEEELNEVAKMAGWGGVKYSDLSHSIGTDYKFSWDKMLAKDGNTAFYLLITYARTRSIGRKIGIDPFDLLGKTDLILETEQELKLAKRLLLLHEAWPNVVKELTPNTLLAYLYEVAKDFGTFWNACPVAKLEDGELKNSRLALAGLVGQVLAWGLSMVGIKALERI